MKYNILHEYIFAFYGLLMMSKIKNSGLKLKLSVLFFIIFSFSTFADERVVHDILRQSLKYNDHSKASIKLSELYQGCPELDCITSIDNPIFVSGDEAVRYLDNEPVMVVNYNGVNKAYSLRIMQYHEVVNDRFGDKYLAITYCPLCNSAVALVPKVDGHFTTFGVSGLIHKSDLVLYDRRTRSLWGQITGEAIVGPRTGDKLQRIYAGVMNWKHAKQIYPNLQALVPPTDTKINYHYDNFSEYKQSDNILFPVPLRDARLLNKTEIIGFEIAGQAVAIELKYLRENRVFMERINGKTVNIVLKNDGSLKSSNLTDNKPIIPIWMYWFAWYNFHPTTLLVKSS